MIKIDLSNTPSGKLKLTAESSVGKVTKYSSSTGYAFYVVNALERSVTFKRGEVVWEPSLEVSIAKRTSSKEAAEREFRLRGGEGSAVFARMPVGSELTYVMVARGSKVAPPE